MSDGMVRTFEYALDNSIHYYDPMEMENRIEMAYVVHEINMLKKNINTNGTRTFFTYDERTVPINSVFKSGPFLNDEIIFTVAQSWSPTIENFSKVRCLSNRNRLM